MIPVVNLPDLDKIGYGTDLEKRNLLHEAGIKESRPIHRLDIAVKLLFYFLYVFLTAMQGIYRNGLYRNK